VHFEKKISFQWLLSMYYWLQKNESILPLIDTKTCFLTMITSYHKLLLQGLFSYCWLWLKLFRKTAPKVESQLKRDLDAKTRSEIYRCRFRLPVNERLDGEVVCHLLTPYNRSNVSGKVYISNNFVCFASKVRDRNWIDFIFMKTKF